MATEHGGPFDLAQVRSIESNGRAHLVYFGGRFFYVGADRYDEPLGEGDIVFVDPETLDLEPAPPGLWPDPAFVAVVKYRTEADTVVEAGGRLALLETNEVVYRVDNTVLADETRGVIRVIAETPIRSIDLGLHDEPDIERRFMVGTEDCPTFEDFAGLPAVKRRARELVDLSLSKADKLAAIGAKPLKGALFTGDPGTGKTMLARIVAREAEAAFFLVTGSQVNSKWFGESEQTVHAIFQTAAKHSRSIIFFDEIDSIAGRRTSRGNEAQRAVVTQLLTEMDGFVQKHDVMVIAATNRPRDIDPALRRPGRFDFELYFPMPTEEDRVEILQLLGDKHQTVGSLPYAWLASRTAGWSPAELAGVFSEAALLAAGDERSSVADEDLLGGYLRAAAQHSTRRREEETDEAS